MEHLCCTQDVIRKVAIWTLVGFLVIVLFGPILTLIGILLPFALVGFLVWLVVRGIVVGPQAAGRAVGHVARTVFRTVIAVPRWIVSHVAALVARVGHIVWGSVRFVGGITLPMLAGGFLGALLGAIGGVQHHDADFRVPAGALIGAGVGLFAVLVRTKPTKAAIVRPLSEGLHKA